MTPTPLQQIHCMRLAAITAVTMSKDPSTQVGAVIVATDYRKLSIGYNGFAAGVHEHPDYWQRPEKYERVIHAELNAIINCPFDTRGCHLYCTHQPCYKCMAICINAGIEAIYYRTPYDNDPRPDITQEYASHMRVVHMDWGDVMIKALQNV